MSIRKEKKVQPKDFFEDDLLDKSLELGEYWRDLLRLNDWAFVFVIHDLDNGISAQIEPDFVYRRATIFISPSVPDDELEYDIVHELLHIRLGIVRFYAKMFLDDDKRLTNERNQILLVNEERTVDLMARILIYIKRGGDNDGHNGKEINSQ